MLFFPSARAISSLCGCRSRSVPTTPALAADPHTAPSVSCRHGIPTRTPASPIPMSLLLARRLLARVSPVTPVRSHETVQASTWPPAARRCDQRIPSAPSAPARLGLQVSRLPSVPGLHPLILQFFPCCCPARPHGALRVRFVKSQPLPSCSFSVCPYVSRS